MGSLEEELWDEGISYLGGTVLTNRLDSAKYSMLSLWCRWKLNFARVGSVSAPLRLTQNSLGLEAMFEQSSDIEINIHTKVTLTAMSCTITEAKGTVSGV